MKTSLVLVLTFLCLGTIFSQEDDRLLLRGKVLYRNVSVPNENVINITTEEGTITDDDGQFSIWAKVGDEIVFTAINYQMKVVKVSAEILKKNRLVVEVNEKVTELDEIVVTPDDQERFLQVKNDEFKQFEYEQDRSSEVENIAMSQSQPGMKDGINFVNIFKLLLKSKKSKEDTRPRLKVSEVLRQVYDDEFFVVDLKLPQDKIESFLMYCDNQMPAQSLLKKTNEFQLIDFLVTHSKEFRKILDAEK